MQGALGVYSRALMGTWIEIACPLWTSLTSLVVPSWARGLKCPKRLPVSSRYIVVPSWARGLKFFLKSSNVNAVIVVPSWARGLKSILVSPASPPFSVVVPSWARGLKSIAPGVFAAL